MIRKLVVAALLAAGFLTWLLSMILLWLTMWLAVLGRKLEPEGSTYGNCWTYALPRWHAQGGYLLVRPADKIRFLHVFKVWHCAWVRVLPQKGLVIEQADPKRRSTSRWIPWRTVWYDYQVKTVEVPHPLTLED